MATETKRKTVHIDDMDQSEGMEIASLAGQFNMHLFW